MDAMFTDSPDSLSVRMPREEWFDRYQYTVTSNIGESAVTSLSVADIPLSTEELWKLPLRYGHHQGLPELREAIAAQYPGLTADDILITAGASEAIVLVAQVLLDQRSRAVIEHPTYPTMYLVPRGLGATVDLLRLRPEQEWRPDWSEVRSMLADGAQFFAITHPNNPTGSMISADELQTAVDIARATDVRLVGDETCGLMTVGDPLLPAASLDPRAISISTMSTTFGLPGIRIGWIACRDAELMQRLIACREHITITNNVLGEHIALQVQRAPEPFIARAKARVAENRAIVAEVVANHPRLDWVPPAAGVVGLPWVVDATDTEVERVYRNLAETRGTFVVPASGFELPSKYFRVGFGGESSQLREGLTPACRRTRPTRPLARIVRQGGRPDGVGPPERPVWSGLLGLLEGPWSRAWRFTLRVERDGRRFTVEVAPDGEGLVSHAGAAPLAEAADRLGLTRALSRGLAGMRERRARHDPGRVVRDLAVMLADGGDCLADLRAVRDQEPLFGQVASNATAFRVIDQVARDPALLEALRAARARARENAWSAGAAPAQIVIDVDATLICAHSEKEGAAGTFKGGFGFHPLLAYLDESREALAGVLRPGNAGANTASDHVEIVELALEQLPRAVVETAAIVVRTDNAAATHELTDELRAARINFLMGFDLTEPVRDAILELPESAWTPAIRQDGETREGAWVAEITNRLNLSAWPEGTGVIVRRERPHPGAQLSFCDHDGHRFLATLTDLAGDPVELERLYRARAGAEDRVRAAKQTGLDNLPFRDFDHNQVWLELSLIAQDLIAWTQRLALDEDLAICEPKTLRYRLLHTAARPAFHARRATLRLQRTWPWAPALAAAFARLAALPPPAR